MRLSLLSCMTVGERSEKSAALGKRLSAAGLMCHLCRWTLAYKVMQACELLLVVTHTVCLLLGPLGIGQLALYGDTMPALH